MFRVVRRISIVAVSLALLCLWKDSPHTAIRAQQTAPPSASTHADASVPLKKEITSLASFNGTWQCQGTFPSNGKRIESQIRFASDLDGAWLLVRHDDTPPNVFHALEMWGFDAQAKQFVAFIYDNFGGVRKFTSPGWDGQQLIWMGEISNATPPTTSRFVYKQDSSTQFVMNWEVNRGNGQWAIGDTLTCKK